MISLSGNSEKDCMAGSLMSMSNVVHEEYEEAFRSNSYKELSDKVRNHLGIPKTLDKASGAGLGQSPSPNPPFDGALLEPCQETLIEMTNNGGSNFHHLLMDYFDVSFEASKICEELLQIVHQSRLNLHIIKRVVKLVKMECDCTDNIRKGQILNRINGELSSYSRVDNPLSTFNPVEFRDTQNGHGVLFKKLVTKYRRTRRRMKITRSFKKVLGGTLIASFLALAKTLLSLAFHSILGIKAASGLVMKFKKPGKLSKKVVSSSSSKSSSNKLDRLGTQLDVAARGVYILINDLNTISRIGGRLHDEIEHGKAIANIYVRSGKGKMLKEVIKEFRRHENCYVELLKEFEDQVYLCLVNVNRSRRLLVEEEEEEEEPT